jgi:hypothetical protein
MRAILFFLLVFNVLTSSTSLAATYSIDTTANNSALSACTPAAADCSFAGALTRANADATLDTLNFMIPYDGSVAGCDAGLQACFLDITASPALSINQPLIIDGSTQAGHVLNTIAASMGPINAEWSIEIGGPTLANTFALVPNADTTLRNVKFVQARLALRPTPSNGKTLIIEGCAFGGSRLSKSTPSSSMRYDFQNLGTATDTIRIGGLNAAQRNWIPAGYVLLGEPNSPVNVLMQGNLIGLNKTGTAIPLTGTFVDERETFADTRHPNSTVLIGGADPNARNYIAGGTYFFGTGNDYTAPPRIFVQNNAINVGTGSERIEPGFTMVMDGGVKIGGSGANEGNLIRGGLRIETSRNQVVGNQFLGSRGRAIRVFWPTFNTELNDVNDADSAVQFRAQNFPEIKAVVLNANNTLTVTYRVDSTTANSSYPLSIEFYLGASDDGEVVLGRDSYLAAEAQQDKTTIFPVPVGYVLQSNTLVTATATTTEPMPETSGMTLFPLSISIDAPAAAIFPNMGNFVVRALIQRLGSYPNFAYGRMQFIASGAGQANSTCIANLLPTATLGVAEASCTLPSSGALTIGQMRIVAANFDPTLNLAVDELRGPFVRPGTTKSFTVVGDLIFCNGYEDAPTSACP